MEPRCYDVEDHQRRLRARLEHRASQKVHQGQQSILSYPEVRWGRELHVPAERPQPADGCEWNLRGSGEVAPDLASAAHAIPRRDSAQSLVCGLGCAHVPELNAPLDSAGLRVPAHAHLANLYLHHIPMPMIVVVGLSDSTWVMRTRFPVDRGGDAEVRSVVLGLKKEVFVGKKASFEKSQQGWASYGTLNVWTKIEGLPLNTR